MNVKKHYSYGIIPLQYKKGEWYVLLIQLKNGKHWSFPKGHAEKDETPLETAKRELLEETGLSVKILVSETPFHESYFFRNREEYISKSVDYFPAEVEGEIVLQQEEVMNYMWIKLEEAEAVLTYPASKGFISKLRALLP